ncbi:MAG: hypothetical protein GX873_02780 [Parcubacteria group bacterium]|nr:hypothetical protein [Parcubacteria group bacterium]
MKGLKLIGKGLFSKVYSTDDLDYVIINKNDYIKEAMAFDWFPDSRYFPKIDEIKINDDYYWKMKKYNKTKKIKGLLNDQDYKFYQELRKIFKTKPIIKNKDDSYSVLYKLFSESSLLADQKELMLDALSACSNYGSDVGFEISPRNIFIESGRLILADCFFIISQVEEIRRKK